MNDESDEDRAFSSTAASEHSTIVSDEAFIMNTITDADAIITDATTTTIVAADAAADAAVNAVANESIDEVNLSVSTNTSTAAALKDVSVDEAIQGEEVVKIGRLSNMQRMREERTFDTLNLRDRWWQYAVVRDITKLTNIEIDIELDHMYADDRMLNAMFIKWEQKITASGKTDLISVASFIEEMTR